MKKHLLSLQSNISRFFNLKDKFESILESHSSEIDSLDCPLNEPFFSHVELNALENLKFRNLPDDENDKIKLIFKTLKYNFNAGILFTKNQTIWNATIYFHNGHLFECSNDDYLSIDLPQISPLCVMKSKSSLILENLKLKKINIDDKFTSFLLMPTNNFAIVLLSDIGEPWLPEFIVKVRDYINNYLVPDEQV